MIIMLFYHAYYIHVYLNHVNMELILISSIQFTEFLLHLVVLFSLSIYTQWYEIGYYFQYYFDKKEQSCLYKINMEQYNPVTAHIE